MAQSSRSQIKHELQSKMFPDTDSFSGWLGFLPAVLGQSDVSSNQASGSVRPAVNRQRAAGGLPSVSMSLGSLVTNL
ncbi:unnamed protein product [Boreogadus saida]